jgi:ABC-type glycerol-3-phosphate transport system substrate-binding protein
MGNVVQQRYQRAGWRLATAVAATLATITFLPSAASANTTVNLNFSQWWAPQMAGHNSLQNLINQFETQNPGIHVTLETAPYVGGERDDRPSGNRDDG